MIVIDEDNITRGNADKKAIKTLKTQALSTMSI